jgi:hypothetical protein
VAKKKAAEARAPAPTPSANTIFTDDAAARARARLKAKLGTLRSGFDPEMLQDGLTLAGYYVERGARTFTAYARDDLRHGRRDSPVPEGVLQGPA